MYPASLRSHASRSLAISAALLLVACAEAKQPATAPTDDSSGGPALAKPAPTTPLGVTVDDAGFRITSDGGGEYLDGSQGVQAYIDGIGNLQFRTGTTGRTLNFDFSAQQTGTPYTPDQSSKTGVSAVTLLDGVNFGPQPKLTDLAVGVGGCYPLVFGFDPGTQVLFHRGMENTLASQSTYAYIRRTSTTTWTMVSNGPCPTNADWAGLWIDDQATKKTDFIFKGYYSLPFSLHLRTLP